MDHQEIIIHYPPSNIIGFGFNRKLGTYDSRHYSPEQTGGRISQAEIKHMLSEINNIRKPYVDSVLRMLICYFITFILSVGIFIPYQIFIAGANGILILVGTIIFLAIIGLLPRYLNERTKKLEEKAREEAKTLIDRYNQDLVTRGLRWELKFPLSVDLCKLYEESNTQYTNRTTTGGYIPPAQHTTSSPS